MRALLVGLLVLTACTSASAGPPPSPSPTWPPTGAITRVVPCHQEIARSAQGGVVVVLVGRHSVGLRDATTKILDQRRRVVLSEQTNARGYATFDPLPEQTFYTLKVEISGAPPMETEFVAVVGDCMFLVANFP